MNDSCQDLIEKLDAAMGLGAIDKITERIKANLELATLGDRLLLPRRLIEVKPECYARRLLHRDPKTGYTVVIMTWGPGQRTPLHDHAGMWCVECCVQGAMTVEQYDLVERRDGRFRFLKQNTVEAVVGDAGCLIPPFEYHVLGNALRDERSVSLHVYAGEMDHCNLYRPADRDWWESESRPLTYDN